MNYPIFTEEEIEDGIEEYGKALDLAGCPRAAGMAPGFRRGIRWATAKLGHSKYYYDRCEALENAAREVLKTHHFDVLKQALEGKSKDLKSEQWDGDDVLENVWSHIKKGTPL